MAKWTHLSPSRTQKLSTSAAKIVNAKIARCRANMAHICESFFYFISYKVANQDKKNLLGSKQYLL